MNPIVQRVGNDDYPDFSRGMRGPLPFPEEETNFCYRMNVRVYVPSLNETRILEEVLVPVPEENSDSESDCCSMDSEGDTTSNNAYWMKERIMEAIFGEVRYGIILKPRRRSRSGQNQGMENEDYINDHLAQWEITNESCAIKQIDRERIKVQQGQMTENPIEEIRAMQFVSRYLLSRQAMVDGESDTEAITRTACENNVLLPLCALTDHRYYYSVMPLCNGGDFFDYLCERGRLTENEARYWMRQILTGVRTLQDVGICHRDLSLENLLLHNSSSLIMDFGMCCRIPYTDIPHGSNEFIPRERRGERLLLRPDRPMGKLSYMSPEIYRSTPFDGHAVDLWAVAVMLFMMVTGSNAWEAPERTNYIFYRMTRGQIYEFLSGPDFGLTAELMDLLGKMFFFNPEDRIGLEQIYEHPWMQGEIEPPVARQAWAMP